MAKEDDISWPYFESVTCRNRFTTNSWDEIDKAINQIYL